MNQAVVCRDFAGRTCIQLTRTSASVTYVSLDMLLGLIVYNVPTTEFDLDYVSMPEYGVKHAAGLYLAFAEKLGASPKSLELLGAHIGITEAVRARILAVRDCRGLQATVETQVRAAKATEESAAAVVRKPSKPAATPRSAKTAASEFKRHLMEGVLYHDEIFETVAAEFNIEPRFIGHVKWYYNFLKREGFNPPALKTGKRP